MSTRVNNESYYFSESILSSRILSRIPSMDLIRNIPLV